MGTTEADKGLTKSVDWFQENVRITLCVRRKIGKESLARFKRIVKFCELTSQITYVLQFISRKIILQLSKNGIIF